MKIIYAKFVNFKHLYSALGKYEVVLDFKDMTNIINVIIGKMGSGKTTILSHLQPWASFGTLDERNSDGIIIDEKNGTKIIEIQDGVDIYHIEHQWTWSKDHHTLKSYIKKNDKELNNNGNQSSFKEIIELEMGVDQNFLRLSRLGPNVSNLIEMTSAERKDFIAERLSDVDLYLTIFKDMSERSRTITAQTQLLSKKLQNVTDATVDEMRDTLRGLKKTQNELSHKVDDDMSEYNKIIGEIHVYLDGLDSDEYSHSINSHQNAVNKISDDILNLEEKIQDISSGYKSSAEVLQKVGELETLVRIKTSDIQTMKASFTELSDRRNEIVKTKSASVNNEYLKSLSETYAEQAKLVECIANELGNFNCKYTSYEIKALMSSVQVFDMMLGDIFDYKRESVLECLNKDPEEVRSYVNKVVDSLRGKKFKLQKSLNNIEFLGRYSVDEDLGTPTCGCHKTCPYYRTHPNNVYSSSANYDEKHHEIMSQIEDLDSRIDAFSEFPTITAKLDKVKSTFIDLTDKLDNLGVVRVKSIKAILSSNSNRVWYDNDALVNLLEKVTKKEQMYSLQVKLPEMKAEIDKYSSVNLAEISVELDELNLKINTIKENILKLETEVSEHKKEIDHLHDINDSILNMESLKSQISELQASRDKMLDKLDIMHSNFDKSLILQDKSRTIYERMNERKDSLKEVNDSISKLSTKLSDIESTRAEFGSLIRKQEIINLLKEAASSKKGIPLVYVQIFLDDCVDIINELISMVFDDAIEIKEFKITEKEFFIPYYKNGIEISDVKTASQGERAIISLALSFALMRKGVAKYNILLLDEIDGALYSKDREKFLMILAQQIHAINAEQVFLITHNNCFDGYPINVIMTTPEHVDNNDVPTLYV
jgi:DNA repair exonuclease SbcCD ATPase subunit